MSSLNRATLIGNLGADPEIRSTQSGNKVASFSIATSETWKDKTTGERKERTEWHRIVVFNDGLCGVIEQYVKKGSKIMVEGKLQTRKWTDNAGVDRYSTEVVLQAYGGQLILLGDGRGAIRPPPVDSADDYGSSDTAPVRERRDEFDDDIPF